MRKKIKIMQKATIYRKPISKSLFENEFTIEVLSPPIPECSHNSRYSKRRNNMDIQKQKTLEKK